MDFFEIMLQQKMAGGGGSGGVSVDELSVTENKTYTAEEGHAYSPVIVNVPNSYDASDEGKVVSNGALVGQTSVTKTANGTYDTTLNNEIVVNVPTVTPTGNINITSTAQTDVSAYATAQVVDADLVAGNIKKDVDILGVVGTYEGGGGGEGIDIIKLLDKTIQTADIPEGATKIMNVFVQCHQLTSVVCPTTLATIDSNAFYSCSNLMSFTIKATTPPLVNSGAFTNVPNNMAIYVPASAVSDYKSDIYWRSREAYIQAIPE